MQNAKDLLRKIKLIEKFSTAIPLHITELIIKLDNIIDEDGYNILEGFSSSKNEYKGTVNNGGFTVKRKLKSFSNDKLMAVAHGSFTEQKDSTKIEIEIIGYDNFMKIFYCFQIVFWSIFLYFTLKSDTIFENKNSEFGLLVMPLFGLIFLISPYFMMRRSMKRLKYDLERELFYLTRK